MNVNLYQLVKSSLTYKSKYTHLYYIKFKNHTDTIVDFDTMIYLIVFLIIQDYEYIEPIDINEAYKYIDTHRLLLTYDTLLFLNISTSANVELVNINIKGDE